MDLNFKLILDQAFILLGYIMVGYIIKKAKLVNESFFDSMSKLLLSVFLPAMIIYSMQREFNKEMIFNSMGILICSISIYTVLFFFSLYYPKFSKGDLDSGIYQYTLMFSNVGFFGYPILKSLIGDVGVFYGAIYNLPFNFLLFTIGVYFLKKSEYALNWKLLLNPGIIASVIGFMFFVFSIRLPFVLGELTKNIGDMTIPMSMFIVGGVIAGVNFKSIFSYKEVYVVSMFRLIIIPLSALIVLKMITNNFYIVTVPVIILAMPAASTLVPMAKQYNANSKLGSITVLLTTIMSLFTIPIISYLAFR